jgi:hypothetical protein
LFGSPFFLFDYFFPYCCLIPTFHCFLFSKSLSFFLFLSFIWSFLYFPTLILPTSSKTVPSHTVPNRII